MKTVFISTTNKYFEELIGIEVELHIDLIATYTFKTNDVPFEFRHGICRTSLIEQINYNKVSRNCYDIEIKTENSKYIFRYGTKTEEEPLTKEEKLEIQIGLGMDIVN